MTASASTSGSAEPQRFDTGIPNLDLVLGAGLLRGSVVMVIGPPGSGKTILAQQMAFRGAQRGENTLYLTGYSETHHKLLAHNRTLDYFSAATIGTQIHMASIPDLLAQGWQEAERVALETARSRRVSLVVLDGFRSMRGFLESDLIAAQFLYSLGAKLALIGATLLVLVEGDAEDRVRDPEQSVCDVIISLLRVRRGGNHRRQLEVLKVRGAAPLVGIHPFTIDSRGVYVYPRLESVVPANERPWTGHRAGFGIPEVDAMVGGGLNVGTSTLSAGTPGVGKTLLGVHFLAEGARRDEPGLFASFIENAVQLRQKAKAFGMDLEAGEKAGLLELLTIPPHDLDSDRVAWLIRERIQAGGFRRLVIDSATELEGGLTSPERAPMFLASLSAYFRSCDVTSYLTFDVPTIVGQELSFAGRPLVALAENLLLLRHAEYQGELRRLFSVLKMRFSDFDHALSEYKIVNNVGIQIVGHAPRADGLLTGLARPIYPATPRPRGTRRTREAQR